MPDRVLLDTNLFIIGYGHQNSTEGQVLNALRHRSQTILLLSLPLEDQIRRVARRVGNKDWAGLILNRIWHDFQIEYIALPEKPLTIAKKIAPDIPREDLLIFLTAQVGQATIFVSGNREFLRQTALQQNLFVCYTPLEYLAYLLGD